jgi:hypothetical protein
VYIELIINAKVRDMPLDKLKKNDIIDPKSKPRGKFSGSYLLLLS